ncbi:hypothetical protein DL96DRAFT_1823340 [Flagelloscypha sp. PMI_526]|nr:hypothetical protein DL96DRAFT_1823340 [Flagelloscypha sp. PMI_526]
MTAKLPPPGLDRRVIFTLSDNVIVDTDKDAIDSLHCYLSRASHRSPFLQESWLRNVYNHCVTNSDMSNQQTQENFVPYREFRIRRNLARAVKHTKLLLERLLALPVQPLPTLAEDVMYEIFKWTAIADFPSRRMSLVSSQVQLWVDPVLFAHCAFFKVRGHVSLFFRDHLSPRLQRCRSLVQDIDLGPLVTQTHLTKLPLLFPNTQSLIMRSEMTGLTPTVHPSVVRLQCSPRTFSPQDNLRLSHQLFAKLNTISFSSFIEYPPELDQWEWTQLRFLPLLRDVWLTLDIYNIAEEIRCLTFIRNQIIPHFPKGLELFAALFELRAGTRRHEWRVPELRSFAAGHWDPRTVLLLSDGHWNDVDQSVALAPGENIPLWEGGNRSKSLNVITARRARS